MRVHKYTNHKSRKRKIVIFDHRTTLAPYPHYIDQVAVDISLKQGYNKHNGIKNLWTARILFFILCKTLDRGAHINGSRDIHSEISQWYVIRKSRRNPHILRPNISLQIYKLLQFCKLIGWESQCRLVGS